MAGVPSEFSPRGDTNTQQKSEYDVQRYRNRASLAEAVLKEKIQELSLMRDKLDILQDVVVRMKEHQLHQLAERQQEFVKQEQARNDTIALLQRQLEELESKLAESETDLKQHAQHNESILSRVQQDHETELAKSHHTTSRLQQEKNLLETRVHVMQDQLHDLGQSLETSQNELRTYRSRLQERDSDSQRIQQEHHQQIRLLKQQLEQLEKENNKLALQLKQHTMLEREREESLEIAAAAVRAAETREKALESKVKAMETQVQSQRQENENLLNKIEVLDAEAESGTGTNGDLQELQEQLALERQQHEDQMKLLKSILLRVERKRQLEAQASTRQKRNADKKAKRGGLIGRVWAKLTRIE